MSELLNVSDSSVNEVVTWDGNNFKTKFPPGCYEMVGVASSWNLDKNIQNFASVCVFTFDLNR
jgi:hypothetical protein